jgi:hypothetical protein
LDAAPKEVDSKTHYHYEYNFLDHKHLVTLNYLRGVGRRGEKAGLLAFEPFNQTPKTLPENRTTFKHDLPEGATVQEEYHYEYSYVYHDHSHYVSAFDAESLPWWELPPWFKDTEKDDQLKFDLTVDVTEDPAQKGAFDIKVEAAQRLLSTLTPEQLRDQTRQADATDTVRKDGPFVKFPVKSAQGYDLIKVPLNKATLTGEVAKGDNSTHKRYIHVQ